jgi:FPC/CPF motif-containing protein YcgG
VDRQTVTPQEGAQAAEVRGNFCRVEDGVLSHPFDPEPPGALTTFVHDSFRALVLNERFSCLGGRAAVHQNAYRFGLYEQMASGASTLDLAADLMRFNSDESLRDKPFTAFVASFVDPVPTGESHFEDLLWSTLQQLHDLDPRPWAAGRRSDPQEPEFSFSFGGVGFFVVGLHASSSRVARRFAWSTLVFNPHRQFDRLRSDGKFSRFRDAIRTRDVALQGTANPMLQDFGEQSEARQYSGRSVEEDWTCPFHSRGGTPERRDE